MDYLYQLKDSWIQDFGPFRAGFVVAACCFLVLVIIFYVLHLMSKKRVREIIIPGSKGALVLSSNAVADMVNTVVANKFRSIAVKKIILWRGNRGTVMEIQGSYDIDGGRLPEVANEMREAILNNLDGQLGITSIKEVVPNIKKITADNINTNKFK